MKALAIVLLGFSLIAACGGNGGSDTYTPPPDSSPTPPTSGSTFDFDLDATGFEAHDGYTALLRVKDGPTVLWCGESAPLAGGVFEFGLSGVIPQGSAIDWQLVVNGNAGNTFEESVDYNYALEMSPIQADVFIEFAYQAESFVDNWPDGQPACGN